MNQTLTATTRTTNAHSVDLEAFRLQLEADGKFYDDNPGSTQAHQRLLHTLQTNDCRDIITAIVDEDDLANAFVAAGYRNHVDVLEAFLNRGMSINSKDENGCSALTCASFNESEECVRFLLDHNADVDFQDQDGRTALMIASQGGNITIVEMLLEKNTNVDLQDENGWTALMHASEEGHKEVVRLLLNHGADIELKDNEDGKTALDLAKDEEIEEILQNHVTSSYVLK